MKKIYFILPLFFLVHANLFSMHIMEGFLPVKWAVSWWVIIIPFLILSLHKINEVVRIKPEQKIFIAMSAAFVFVLSALKIPSLTGSCSHPTGTGFGTILFGPSTMVILSFIVLIFLALLLAHGGLTTLGANTFSMGIAGPFLCFIIYKICKKIKLNNNISIFLAAFLGDLATYCVTSFQLALSYPDSTYGYLQGVSASLVKFMGVFALTQIPLAISEGILTVLTINALKNIIPTNSLFKEELINTSGESYEK